MAVQPFPLASLLTKLKLHPTSQHIRRQKGTGRRCVNVASGLEHSLTTHHTLWASRLRFE